MTPTTIALGLALEQGRTVFEPGARVSGVATWSAPRAPLEIELRLVSTVVGPGGRDVKIAATIPLSAPRADERRPFSLTLPDAPFSFRGTLLSLAWALELVASPGEDKTRLGLTVAPGAREIDLRPPDAPPPVRVS